MPPISATRRKLQEIEAETRYFTLDHVLFMLIAITFAILAMAFVASAIARIIPGFSQVLQHVAARSH
jgi:predicted tellurium resistance membrane protein TerC